METTLERIIRKLELNENEISTILGALVLSFVGFLFIGYYGQEYITLPNNQISKQQGTFGDILSDSKGQISSAATTRYEVQPNDSLWTIAVEQYGDGYKWVDIAFANGLTRPDDIYAGNVIDIPRLADITDDPIEFVAGITDDQTDNENTYTTIAGDTLWIIAQKVYNDGYQWNKIWQANKDQIPNPNIVEKDLTLQIP